MTATQKRRRLTIDDVLIVDADVHVHETAAGLAPYMDAEWRPAIENLKHIESRYLDLPGFSPDSTVLPRVPWGGPPSPGGGRSQIVWDADQMRRELDEFSIDVGILFPDHLLKLGNIPNASYAASIARAYHRWLHEHWLNDDNDLYAVITAIPQNPEEAAREIDYWARYDRFVGVYLPTCEVYPLWGNRKYDPIYEAAARNNLPVFLHAVEGKASGFPYNTEQFVTKISRHTVSHVFGMMANLMSIMETGVPVRFPGLKICFSEAGLTWVPFLRMRLDKEYNENRHQWPHFHDRPSKWIREFYFATQPVEEPENKGDLVDIIRIYDGEDTTVFASDWPHHDFDHPRAVFNLPVSDQMKRKLMGANALKLMPRIRIPAKYSGDYQQGETL